VRDAFFIKSMNLLVLIFEVPFIDCLYSDLSEEVKTKKREKGLETAKYNDHHFGLNVTNLLQCLSMLS
jgi:hypothetical protein